MSLALPLNRAGLAFPFSVPSLGSRPKPQTANHKPQAGLAFPLNGAFFGVSTARRHDLTVSSERDKWLKDWELKVRKDLPMTVVQSTSFWGPVQAINFCLVPPHARALYVNMAFFSWTSYLSLIAYRFPNPD